MNADERRLIDDLFAKLRQAEQQSAPRDGEAERHIAAAVGHQPAAPYYMSQVILVQEQALRALNDRVEELERSLAQRPAAGGGFLGGLFGAAAGQAPASAAVRRAGWTESTAKAEHSNTGGGFMASAAQTALGVAGGVLLANALTGLFASDAAQASEPSAGFAVESDEGPDLGDASDGGDFDLFDDF
ncbi:MAG: DUF2076 domain-containing protein [Chromatiaceae bacterium]|jgi:hypothetical protein|nr:DUF2076 domain-containing protein [Chromatiaceae bacterium]